MENLMLSAFVPFSRGKFHNVIANGNYQICFIQDFILVILLGDSDGPHGIFIFVGNDSF